MQIALDKYLKDACLAERDEYYEVSNITQQMWKCSDFVIPDEKILRTLNEEFQTRLRRVEGSTETGIYAQKEPVLSARTLVEERVRESTGRISAGDAERNRIEIR